MTASACSNSRTCTFTGPDSRRPLRLALAPASGLLFSLRCRLHSCLHPLHRTAKYILTQVLSDGTRGEDTRMLAISHNCGQSDSRTELLQHPFTSQPPITTVGLQTQYLLYCITVIASRFTQRGGTNSCSQTLAPRMFLVSVKKWLRGTRNRP